MPCCRPTSPVGRQSAIFAWTSRWLAIDIDGEFVFIFAYFPQSKHSVEYLPSIIAELEALLHGLDNPMVFIGMDANCRVGRFVDLLQIGPSVMSCSGDDKNSRKAALLHEFLARHGLRFVNTFVEYTDAAELATCFTWTGESASQIDFVACPLGTACSDAWVDTDTSFSTNHYLLGACFELTRHPPRPKAPNLRNWRPDSEWLPAVEGRSWNWLAWDDTLCDFRGLAADHRLQRRQKQDVELKELLWQRKRTPPGERRDIDRKIYRRRRYLKRKRAEMEVKHAAAEGKAPVRKTATHFSWSKVFGDNDPASAIHDCLKAIYSLAAEERTEEEELKHQYVNKWRSLQIDLGSFHISDKV